MSETWNPFREDLIYFHILCEEKNLSRTADRMGVTQPQVSKIIKKFEELYGQQLFVRRSHGVELTSAGEELLNEVNRLNLQWRQYRLNSQQEESPQGFYSLGVNSSIAMSLFPRKIHGILTKYPDLDLQAHFLPSRQVIQKVMDLQFDFGVVAGPLRSPDLVVKKVWDEFVALWSRHSHGKLDVIYYHPEMLYIHRLLKKFKAQRLRPLADYHVIAEICEKNVDSAGIIPSNVAEIRGLSQRGERLFDSPIHLIAHKDRLKSKPFKFLFSELLKP